jgi:hypothetical protein
VHALDPAAAQYVPAAQGVHDTAPGASEYDPGTHAAQVPALSALDAVEKVPASHSWQADEVVAPTVTE